MLALLVLFVVSGSIEEFWIRACVQNPQLCAFSPTPREQWEAGRREKARRAEQKWWRCAQRFADQLQRLVDRRREGLVDRKQAEAVQKAWEEWQKCEGWPQPK